MRWFAMTAVLLTGCSAQIGGPPLPAQAAAAGHLGVAGRCEDVAQAGGGAEGCYLSTSVRLRSTPPAVYWHIDRFPNMASAERTRVSGSAVVPGLGGQIFLQTVNGSMAWRPSGGERLATVGPIELPANKDFTARMMEATTSTAAATHPHAHSGPEAFFLLSGSICVETTAGAHRAGPGGSLILPARTPMQLHSPGTDVRRSLVLVIHPTDEPWIDRQPAWTPTGACLPR